MIHSCKFRKTNAGVTISARRIKFPSAQIHNQTIGLIPMGWEFSKPRLVLIINQKNPNKCAMVQL